MKRSTLSLLTLMLAAALCFSCDDFMKTQEDDSPDGTLEPGLYTFPGVYSPGSTGWNAEKLEVSPFNLANALEKVVDAKNYLIVIDQDYDIPDVMRLYTAGSCLVLRSAGGERRIGYSGTRSGGALFILERSELILENGIVLTGKEGNTLPLVQLGKDAYFAMYEGSGILDNPGGGVFAGREAASNAVFTMYGGEISGCSKTAGNGAGVEVANGAIFTMKGGSILDNEALNGSGGGVGVGSGGRFVLECGDIAGNRASGSGGGVSGSSGSFAMRGGTISGNHSGAGGGGVSGAFAMHGGEIAANTSGSPDLAVKNISPAPSMEGKGGVVEDWTLATGIGAISAPSGGVAGRGQTLRLSVTVFGVGGHSREIIWTIESPRHVYTTIDSNGLLTVASGEMNPTLTIKAQSAAVPEFTAEIVITIVQV
jgi:hypothetical protein